NTTSRIELEAAERKVKELIEAQTKMASSPAEAQLSKEITTAFADYLSRVSKSLDTPPVTPESTASRGAEQKVETGLERLLALRESERRFVDIIDLAMDAIVTVDHDQRIVIFNSAAEEMFRCPAAEAIGSSLERFIPPRYRTTHHHHVREFAQSGKKTRRASE